MAGIQVGRDGNDGFIDPDPIGQHIQAVASIKFSAVEDIPSNYFRIVDVPDEDLELRAPTTATHGTASSSGTKDEAADSSGVVLPADKSITLVSRSIALLRALWRLLFILVATLRTTTWATPLQREKPPPVQRRGEFAWQHPKPDLSRDLARLRDGPEDVCYASGCGRMTPIRCDICLRPACAEHSIYFAYHPDPPHHPVSRICLPCHLADAVRPNVTAGPWTQSRSTGA